MFIVKIKKFSFAEKTTVFIISNFSLFNG